MKIIHLSTVMFLLASISTPSFAGNPVKAVDAANDFRRAATAGRAARAVPIANRTRNVLTTTKAKPFAQSQSTPKPLRNEFEKHHSGLSASQQSTLRKSDSSFKSQKSHKNAFTTRKLPNDGWSVERRVPSENKGYSKIYETQIGGGGRKVLTNKTVLKPNQMHGKVSSRLPGGEDIILNSE